MKITPGNKLYFFVALLTFFNAGHAWSQDNTTHAVIDDCTDISVNYLNSPKMTQQEKIERMDKALFHSLNKYEGCQRSYANSVSSGSGAGNSQDGSNGTEGSNGTVSSSTASSDMSGTETPSTQQASTGDISDNAINPGSESDNTDKAEAIRNTQKTGTGKIPDDIPSVDNDSVLEAQIRHAAMIESDPVIKEKLWNEYRKYKGLPAKAGHQSNTGE